ncbi:MAG: carboxypeptidase-like regulatory domain-containing protein, partial [Blastocatellia bacterium]
MPSFPSLTINRLTVSALLVLWLFGSNAAPPALAQNSTSGAIVGRVFDPQDKPTSGIKVTAINSRSRSVWTRTTDANGTYRFEYLPPGIYDIKAHAMPKYPDVIITDIPTAHPITKTIPAPHITMGRFLFIVRILDRNGRGLPAVVTAVGAEDKHEERTMINGECRFLYLRDGAYKIHIYVGGRLRRTIELTVRFRIKQQDQLQLISMRRIFEIQGNLLAAIKGAIIAARQKGNSVSQENVEASALTYANDQPPVWEAAGNDEPIVDFPVEILQTRAGAPLTLGLATIVRQEPPQVVPAPSPQTAAPAPTDATGSAKVLAINTAGASRNSDFTETQIQALPLGGGAEMRTYDELAFLAPGVAPPPYTHGPRGPGVGFGVNTAGE